MSTADDADKVATAQAIAPTTGDALPAQARSRQMIARMREPTPREARDLDARAIVRHDMPDRRHADSFRDVRTQLLAAARGHNFVSMVAAVSSGGGASFVATNLAAAFAFDESKTALLIDCNLREPSLSQRLGVRAERGGLIDYLDESGPGIEDIIYPTGIARLRLIPAGARREASGEYLASFRMRGLIDSLRARYPDRYIILDAPAITAAPDARILCELADTVIVVASYGRDSTAAVREATAVLDPTRVAGVVFNRVP